MSDPSPSERGQELHLLLAMSSELAQTTDPAETGDLIARHIARATGLDECAVSYWDRAADTVITYGYYPPERRAALELCYRLGDYPETRRVLETQEHSVIDVEDPRADRHEVEYLRTIGNRVSALLPLVAKRETIGLVRARDRRARHVRRHPPGARTVDGQRGRDGARERPAVRGAPPSGAPRPAHRPRQPDALSRSCRARPGAVGA